MDTWPWIIGVALVGVGVALYFFVFQKKSSSSSADDQASQASSDTAPKIVPVTPTTAHTCNYGPSGELSREFTWNNDTLKSQCTSAICLNDVEKLASLLNVATVMTSETAALASETSSKDCKPTQSSKTTSSLSCSSVKNSHGSEIKDCQAIIDATCKYTWVDDSDNPPTPAKNSDGSFEKCLKMRCQHEGDRSFSVGFLTKPQIGTSTDAKCDTLKRNATVSITCAEAPRLFPEDFATKCQSCDTLYYDWANATMGNMDETTFQAFNSTVPCRNAKCSNSVMPTDAVGRVSQIATANRFSTAPDHCPETSTKTIEKMLTCEEAWKMTNPPFLSCDETITCTAQPVFSEPSERITATVNTKVLDFSGARKPDMSNTKGGPFRETGEIVVRAARSDFGTSPCPPGSNTFVLTGGGHLTDMPPMPMTSTTMSITGYGVYDGTYTVSAAPVGPDQGPDKAFNDAPSDVWSTPNFTYNEKTGVVADVGMVDPFSIGNPSPVIMMQLPLKVTVRSYSITNSSSESARGDPFKWQFYGSADGKTWTVLDDMSGNTTKMFEGPSQTVTRQITNEGSFDRFAIVVSYINPGADSLQIAKIKLRIDDTRTYCINSYLEGSDSMTPAMAFFVRDNNQLSLIVGGDPYTLKGLYDDAAAMAIVAKELSNAADVTAPLDLRSYKDHYVLLGWEDVDGRIGYNAPLNAAKICSLTLIASDGSIKRDVSCDNRVIDNIVRIAMMRGDIGHLFVALPSVIV